MANCHAILPSGGSGAIDGSSWAAACNGVFQGVSKCDPHATSGTTMLVRGDIYYMGGGTYTAGAPALYAQTPDLGTMPITIYPATIAQHGQDPAVCSNSATLAVGWSNSMAVDGGAGQVILPKDNTTGLAAWHFATDYWIVDGAPYITSDTDLAWGHQQSKSCTGNQCGFKMDATNALSPNGTWGINIATTVHDITLRAIEAVFNGSTAAGQNQVADAVRIVGGTNSNITVTHCNFHDSPDSYVELKNGITTTVFKYNWFNRSFAYQSTQHGEAFAMLNATGTVIAFNDFQDITGTAFIVDLNSGTVGTSDNTQIYGNLFRYSNGSSLPGSGNGFIACINTNNCTNWKIYNNTFSNVKPGSNFQGISFGSAGSGSNFTLENNIFFNNGDTSHQLCAGCTGTFTSNYYTNNTTTPVGETGEQSDSSIPFVGWTTDNYHLAVDTNAWAPLLSPYNVDSAGVTRTSSRGAFQFLSGAGGSVLLGPVKGFNALFF